MKTPVRTRLLSALLSLVMLVSLLPVSVFAAEPASGTWEKVTEAQEDWSGQYLIVYEKGSLIMDGSLSALDKEGNKVDVTITDGKIVGDYAKYAFTIAPMTGGWSIQSASGKYISGKSGSNKIITGSTPELNTITFADGNVKIASNNTTPPAPSCASSEPATRRIVRASITFSRSQAACSTVRTLPNAACLIPPEKAGTVSGSLTLLPSTVPPARFCRWRRTVSRVRCWRFSACILSR